MNKFARMVSARTAYDENPSTPLKEWVRRSKRIKPCSFCAVNPAWKYHGGGFCVQCATGSPDRGRLTELYPHDPDA